MGRVLSILERKASHEIVFDEGNGRVARPLDEGAATLHRDGPPSRVVPSRHHVESLHVRAVDPLERVGKWAIGVAWHGDQPGAGEREQINGSRVCRRLYEQSLARVD